MQGQGSTHFSDAVSPPKVVFVLKGHPSMELTRDQKCWTLVPRGSFHPQHTEWDVSHKAAWRCQPGTSDGMQEDLPQEFTERSLPRNSKAFGKPTLTSRPIRKRRCRESPCTLPGKDDSAKEPPAHISEDICSRNLNQKPGIWSWKGLGNEVSGMFIL